jgi:hypothetical protein
VVWSLTGIWHGASWNFIFWGLLYFVLLTFEKLTGFPGKFRTGWAKAGYRVLTLLCVVVGWVFFRATTMADGIAFLRSMLHLSGNAFTDDMVKWTLNQYQFFYLGAFLCSTPFFRMAKDKIRRVSNTAAVVLEYLSIPFYCLLLLWAVSYIMLGSHNPFIYFNF